MAAFITADRWSSGIATHKTKIGRIICTGSGCIGCFPETNQTEADELGICDLDFAGHPFRAFLNKDTTVAKNKAAKPRKTNSEFKSENPTWRNLSMVSKTLEKNAHFSEGLKETEKKRVKQVGTQTRMTSIVPNETQLDKSDCQLSDKAKRLVESMRGDIKQRETKKKTGRTVLLEMCELDQTIDSTSANSDYKPKQVAQSPRHRKNVNIDRKVNKTKNIHENLYMLLKKDTALNYHEDIFPKSDSDQTWESSPWDLGEDATCFYFVLEYYNSPRILPRFKVLEIVEALCEVVDARDIKCVQRVYGMWQIVLRTRKDQLTLRAYGIRIRGRYYELIDDVDSYCILVNGCT
ncbi:predicted protein [Nematostella vectensis]|uniref:Uncharacterized protein n=1 Tax=Nematostella vectensis TaxID=45351 RepID=A7RIJ6_NEMVE|nr:uncharacterized protein LOC5521071 [Nematostella vectensis]EDO48818.1 predicted protein [Nematostella vectensis]|eukprot:XP_001640881.1 predicted protein [Nematostella vectensis]